MGRVSRIFLAGTVLATFIPLASFDVARADPALRLAQVPLTPEQQKELEEQKKKAPAARPPAAFSATFSPISEGFRAGFRRVSTSPENCTMPSPGRPNPL